MHHRAVHAVEHLVVDRLAHQHRADRHVAAGQRLGEQHHVGLDVPVLAGEEFSGAADAGLDLVDDEQRAVAAAERFGALEIVVVGQDHALALDRLDHERRHLAVRQRAVERGEIVERHADAIRQQRLEAAAEGVIAVQRKRPIGQAMERMAAIGDAGAARRGARELDRGLDRLGAGIGEEHLVEMRHQIEQPVGQDAGERRDVHLHEVGQVGVERALQRGADRRVVAAEREHAEAAQQVEILPVRAVVEILSASLAKTDIISDGLENTDHLLVEALLVQAEAVGFVGLEQRGNVGAKTGIKTRMHTFFAPGAT